MDQEIHKWPPQKITLTDLGEAPVCLDDYLKDEHIEEILRETFQESELDGSFFE